MEHVNEKLYGRYTVTGDTVLAGYFHFVNSLNTGILFYDQ